MSVILINLLTSLLMFLNLSTHPPCFIPLILLEIEDKKKNLERERLEDKKMYEAMYKEHLMKEDAEKAKQQQRRSTAYEGRKLLEQQIDMKARVRRAEKQAVLLEHRTMLKEERRYMSKVNSLLAEERKAMERLKR